MEELRLTSRSLEDDIGSIKASLVQHLPEEERKQVFNMVVYDSADDFQEFFEQLKDPNFKKLVVRCCEILCKFT